MREKGTMTVYEMGEFVGIGRKKSYELANSEGFPSFRVGRKILISREGLERWLKEQQEVNSREHD